MSSSSLAQDILLTKVRKIEKKYITDALEYLLQPEDGYQGSQDQQDEIKNGRQIRLNQKDKDRLRKHCKNKNYKKNK